MKKIWAGLLICMIGLSLAGCGGGKSAPAPQKSESQKTITIGVMPDVESIPFLIAEKNGYFAKQGVKVKLEHFKSARDRDSALQSGKLDGVITDMLAVVFANEGGIQLRIITKNDGDIKLMAGKDSGISSVAALKGKNIGLSTNTIMEYTVDKMLEAAQIKPEDVNKMAVPQLPTRFEMLQGGKVDAAILPEPFAGLAVKGGAVVLNSTDRMGNKVGAIAFTARSLEENQTEIKAIFRAYNDAVAYLDQEPAEKYLDYIIEAQGFPAEIKDSLQLPTYQKATAPDPEILADVIEWMHSRDLIKGNYEYKDLVDDKVLR